MTRIPGLGLLIEGRRGSRIDSEQGGRYLGIPRNVTFSVLTSVQETGCGTARLITERLHPLARGQQRILCLSCCHSRAAFERMRPRLKGYFTGCRL
jgi:hypothetical protein